LEIQILLGTDTKNVARLNRWDPNPRIHVSAILV